MCGFAGQKNPSRGVPAAFAMCKGPVLLVTRREEFLITENNSLSEKRPVDFLTRSSGNPDASSLIRFTSLEMPVSKTDQFVFSNSSRIISMY